MQKELPKTLEPLQGMDLRVMQNIPDTADPDSNDLIESLKPFAGMDFTQIARLPDVLVAGIIEYYAFYSERMRMLWSRKRS